MLLREQGRSLWTMEDTGLYMFTFRLSSPIDCVQLVDVQSASLLGKRMMYLNTDHPGLSKFDGLQDENFTLLLSEIKRMVEVGPSIVVDRHGRKGIR